MKLLRSLLLCAMVATTHATDCALMDSIKGKSCMGKNYKSSAFTSVRPRAHYVRRLLTVKPQHRPTPLRSVAVVGAIA